MDRVSCMLHCSGSAFDALGPFLVDKPDIITLSGVRRFILHIHLKGEDAMERAAEILAVLHHALGNEPFFDTLESGFVYVDIGPFVVYWEETP